MTQMTVAENLWESLMLDTLLKPVLDSQIGLTADPQEIARRNAVLKTLFREKALLDHGKMLHAKINALHELIRLQEVDVYQLLTILPLLKEIQICMDMVCRDITESASDSQSEDLVQLRDLCSSILREEFKPDFDRRWGQVISMPEDLQSLHYRFFLNADLQVTHFALLSLNKKPFRSRNRLRSRLQLPGQDMEILAHMTNAKENMHHRTEKFVAQSAAIPSYATLRSARELFRSEVMQNRLPDLAYVLPKAIPAIQAKQTQVIWGMIRDFGHRILQRMAEQNARIKFWLSAVTVMKNLEAASLPFCFASIHPAQERTFRARNAYHPAVALTLAHPETLVYNDIDLNSHGAILLLTGANGGGKTTYLRTVGAIQLFFQLGLPVPAQQADLSPVDAIVAVFSRKEDTHLISGKLGQELLAMREALESIHGESLVLFNEPITGTSVGACCLISQEVIAILKALQARGIWVTHHFALLDKIASINESLPGVKVGHMHLSDKKDYRMVFGEGHPNSRAIEGYDRIVLGKRAI